jgi:hypothetical protein
LELRDWASRLMSLKQQAGLFGSLFGLDQAQALVAQPEMLLPTLAGLRPASPLTLTLV